MRSLSVYFLQFRNPARPFKPRMLCAVVLKMSRIAHLLRLRQEGQRIHSQFSDLCLCNGCRPFIRPCRAWKPSARFVLSLPRRSCLMNPTYPLFPVFALCGSLLVLIPLPWHVQAWNVGTCAYIIWASVACLFEFINSLVWNGNILNPAPVWCDICTSLQ
jgi:hypothetical protein